MQIYRLGFDCKRVYSPCRSYLYFHLAEKYPLDFHVWYLISHSKFITYLLGFKLCADIATKTLTVFLASWCNIPRGE